MSWFLRRIWPGYLAAHDPQPAPPGGTAGEAIGLLLLLTKAS